MEADRTLIAADGRDVAIITSAPRMRRAPVPTADAPVELAVEGTAPSSRRERRPSSHEPDRFFATGDGASVRGFSEQKTERQLRTGGPQAEGASKRSGLAPVLRHFGASAVVELNGKRLITTR